MSNNLVAGLQSASSSRNQDLLFGEVYTDLRKIRAGTADLSA
jgi:hypothetical protein